MTDSLQDLLAKLHEAVGNELLQRIIAFSKIGISQLQSTSQLCHSNHLDYPIIY